MGCIIVDHRPHCDDAPPATGHRPRHSLPVPVAVSDCALSCTVPPCNRPSAPSRPLDTPRPRVTRVSLAGCLCLLACCDALERVVSANPQLSTYDSAAIALSRGRPLPQHCASSDWIQGCFCSALHIFTHSAPSSVWSCGQNIPLPSHSFGRHQPAFIALSWF